MRRLLAPIPSIVLLNVACSRDFDDTDYPDTGWQNETGDWDDNDTQSDTQDESDSSPPPEVEDDLPPLAPAQTDQYVFIANPDRDTLTRVHVASLDVRTTPVGRDPRIVLTSPDHRRAVVFNRGDDSLSVVEASTLASRNVPLRPHHNALVMSPDGAWVAAFHNQDAERTDDPPVPGMQSYNELSLVHLDSGRHVAMAVGYNPRAVHFTADAQTAVVITDAWLAVVDLTAPEPRPRLIQITEDLLDAPRAEEVLLARSGSWAFVRQFGATSLAIVQLDSGEVTRVPVGANPTDLDLAPGGAEAVVLCRDDRQLWVFDAEAPLSSEPRVVQVPGEDPFGSLVFAPDGSQAILFTTASPVPRYASWRPEDDSIRLRTVVKPIRSVSVSPTSDTALFFHTKTDAPEADPTSPFRNRWALTITQLDDLRTNPIKLPNEPISFAHADTGERGYFVMRDVPTLVALDYASMLHAEVPLRSPPLFVGVLPDPDPADTDRPRAWASQEHPLGRITLYDPDDGAVETLTGFELNAQVED